MLSTYECGGLPPFHALTLPQFLLVSECFYTVTMIMLKVSLSIFLLRIMVKGWQRLIIYSAATLSVLFGISMFFWVTFQCGYVKNASVFINRISAGQCVSWDASLGMSYAYAGVITMTDLVFAILPWFMLRDTKMTTKAKITVGLILGLGAV